MMRHAQVLERWSQDSSGIVHPGIQGSLDFPRCRAHRCLKQPDLPLALQEQPLCKARRSLSSFFEEEKSDREHLLDVQQEAMRSRAKSSRVEGLSVWVKKETKSALAISSRANRVAMGALLFTILGVALDVTSNIITVFSTKRDMAEVEDEAAQVYAQSRQRSEATRRSNA